MTNASHFPDTLNVYKFRSDEIDLYLEQLLEFEESASQNKDFYNMLKANAFLMIYNMVEATMTELIGELYDHFAIQKDSIDTFSDNIQLLIFDRIRGVINAKVSEFKAKSSLRGFSNNVMQTCFSLTVADKKKLFSGNIDARKMRDICDDFGVELNLDEECNNGSDLALIKDNRNLLAHGGDSFGNIGKGTTASELKNIKDRVDVYFENFLKSMAFYVFERKYVKQDALPIPLSSA
jgi:hypothetical protein